MILSGSSLLFVIILSRNEEPSLSNLMLSLIFKAIAIYVASGFCLGVYKNHPPKWGL